MIAIKEKYRLVIEYFKNNVPVAETELHFSNPFQLAVAVILSAQCTDKRVNLLTPALFERFPSPLLMSQADVDEIFQYIKSCSYPNNKAKHLSGMSKKIMDDYNGKVPCELEDLMKLPGVGRKTANVIAAVAFGLPAMPVDTHVFRVSVRLGLVKKVKTPYEAEKQLVKNIPGDLLVIAHHWLILHGRYICTARKPKCSICGLYNICEYYEKNKMTYHS